MKNLLRGDMLQHQYLDELGFRRMEMSLLDSFTTYSFDMVYSYGYEAVIKGFPFRLLLDSNSDWKYRRIKLIMFTPIGYQILESIIDLGNLKYHINILIERYEN